MSLLRKVASLGRWKLLGIVRGGTVLCDHAGSLILNPFEQPHHYLQPVSLLRLLQHASLLWLLKSSDQKVSDT